MEDEVPLDGCSRRLSFSFSLRCEIVLSMAALNNPDFHELQKRWVERAKTEVPETTLQQIRDLFLHSHEAVMIRALSRCKDSIDDTLECLTHLSERREDEIFQILFSEEDLETAKRHLNFFKEASNGIISEETRGFFTRELGIRKEREIVEFSKRYTTPRLFVLQLRDALNSYWNIFFKREWTNNLLPELEEIVASLAETPIDILGFLEKQTGKKIQKVSEIIVYVSHFVQPHGLGFMEKGRYAVVVDKYSIKARGLKGVYHTIIHETLHPLMRNVFKDPRLRPLFERFKENEELMRLYNETIMGRYGWEGLIEENITAAFTRFLEVNLDIEEERNARQMLYTGLQRALFDDLLRNYDVKTYRSIDDFLLEVLEKEDLIKAVLPREIQRRVFQWLSKQNTG